MRVQVEYLAQIKQAAGVAREHVELDRPCLLHEFVLKLADRRGEPFRKLLVDVNGQLHSTILLFLNDEQVAAGKHVELQGGESVTLLSPMAGG